MATNERARPRRSNAQRGPTSPRSGPASDSRRPRPRRPRQTGGPRFDGAQSPPAPFADLGAVLDAFTESWDRGEKPRAEGFLDLLPAGDSAELIYHEYCLAEASDLDPDPDEYLRRFPEHAEALGRLFRLHGALSVADLKRWAEPADLPRVGDDIGPYRLIRELGQGAFARVFLAEQSDLDDRLVVLKVSTRATAEPRLLARASHPNIVGVLRHASTEDGFHLVCMPFLGGATLAAILEARQEAGRPPRSGADLLADLDLASAPGYQADGSARPSREAISGLSYPRASAWIVARLAEALEHAHRRGVAHGDLKPSNILVTAEGVPMLFDFNLAVDWREAGPDALAPGSDAGGTLAYMAPERLASLAGAGESRTPRASDRHRADLYALGLVLLEMLTGRSPELPRDRPRDQKAMASALASLRSAMPLPPRGRRGRPIPPGLGAILARCLAPDPADRYARGLELAEDLDRWRASLPLAHAAEPRRSGLAGWARRHRRSLAAGTLTLLIASGAAALTSHAIVGTLGDKALDKMAGFLDRPDAGVFLFRKFGNWRFDELGDPAENARRHLDRYNVLGDGDWTLRDDIRFLPERERGELHAWIVEQAWRYAEAIADRPDSPADWRVAANLLDRTIAHYPLAPLLATRLAQGARLATPAPARGAGGADPAPPRWMEDFLAGVAAESRHARRALGHYEDALAARPDFFWAHYRAGVVACRINDYPAATRHLQACVARRPDNAALHAQLGALLYKLSQPGANKFDQEVDDTTRARDALAECDRALAIDPEFAEALATRAVIHQGLGMKDAAGADVGRFSLLTRFRGEWQSLMLRFKSGFFYGPSYDKPMGKDRELLDRALASSPEDGDIRFTLASTHFADGAIGDAVAGYDRVLDRDPEHLPARYLRALARHRKGDPGAIAEFAALIDHPRFEEFFREDPSAIRAYHYVATDLLKSGRIAPALDVAELGLIQAERYRLLAGGKVLIVGESNYLLARIHAASADRPGRMNDVVVHLKRAFGEHPKFRRQWFARDPYFDGIREAILGHLPE